MNGKHSNNPRVQAQKIAAFLKAYERCGMIKTAAKAVPMSHGNHFHWLATVPGYAERFAAAVKAAEERLGSPAVSTLYSIAVEGTMDLVRDKDGNQVWDPVDKEGNPVRPEQADKIDHWVPAMTRTYHVGALQFLLKSLYPDKFGDKQKIDHTSGGKPIKFIGGVDEQAL